MDFRWILYIYLPDFQNFVGDPPHLVHYTPVYLSDFENFDRHPPHLVHYTPVYLPKFKNEKTPPPRLWVSTLPYDPPPGPWYRYLYIEVKPSCIRSIFHKPRGDAELFMRGIPRCVTSLHHEWLVSKLCSFDKNSVVKYGRFSSKSTSYLEFSKSTCIIR